MVIYDCGGGGWGVYEVISCCLSGAGVTEIGPDRKRENGVEEGGGTFCSAARVASSAGSWVFTKLGKRG
jgi:hypothetical protein